MGAESGLWKTNAVDVDPDPQAQDLVQGPGHDLVVVVALARAQGKNQQTLEWF